MDWPTIACLPPKPATAGGRNLGEPGAGGINGILSIAIGAFAWLGDGVAHPPLPMDLFWVWILVVLLVLIFFAGGWWL